MIVLVMKKKRHFLVLKVKKKTCFIYKKKLYNIKILMYHKSVSLRHTKSGEILLTYFGMNKQFLNIT